jgi:hypothetical protein
MFFMLTGSDYKGNINTAGRRLVATNCEDEVTRRRKGVYVVPHERHRIRDLR